MQPKVDAQLCSDCGSVHEMMQPCAMHEGYHSLMLTDVRRDIGAIKCRWVPYSVQLAAEGTPALVTATRVTTRVCRLQPVASMATRKDCEGAWGRVQGGTVAAALEGGLLQPAEAAPCTRRHRKTKTATTKACLQKIRNHAGGCYLWTGFYLNSDAMLIGSLFKCSLFVLVNVALSDRSNFERT